MAKRLIPMTEGSIWKRITYFALPLFFGNLFQQMYNTVDSLIVGNFLGSSALAAVSSSSSLIFMLIGLFSGLASGAGVIISRQFGARNTESMRLAVHTAVAFGLAAGIFLTVVGIALSPQILIWMSTPPNVMKESVAYLQVYFAGSIGFVMYNVFVGILQAVGDSRHPLLLPDFFFHRQSGFGHRLHPVFPHRRRRGCPGYNHFPVCQRPFMPVPAHDDKGKLPYPHKGSPL